MKDGESQMWVVDSYRRLGRSASPDMINNTVEPHEVAGK